MEIRIRPMRKIRIQTLEGRKDHQESDIVLSCFKVTFLLNFCNIVFKIESTHRSQHFIMDYLSRFVNMRKQVLLTLFVGIFFISFITRFLNANSIVVIASAGCQKSVIPGTL